MKRILYNLCVVVFSMMVAGSAVLQFHHHDSDGCVCLYTWDSDCDGQHSHGDGCPENDSSDCSLHIDKFITEKYHLCVNPHCAVHFAQVALPSCSAGKPLPCSDIPLAAPPQPRCRTSALRAPPALS